MAKDSTGGLIIMGALGVGVGAFFYLTGLWEYRLRKTIQYTPTCKAIALAPGIAEVSGVAREINEFTAPFSKKKCAYYRTEVYKWSGSGKNRKRHLSKRLESPEPVYIEDDTGIVLVYPGKIDAGKIEIGLDSRTSATPKAGFLSGIFSGGEKNETESREKKFLEEFVPSLANYGDRVDIEEKFVCRGDPLYAIGCAMEAHDAGKYSARMEIVPAKEKNNLFLLCDGTEKNALSSVGLTTYLKIIGGPILLLAGVAMLASLIAVKISISLASIPMWLGIFTLVAMYAYAALQELFEVYNGMVILRNNADRALANVRVLQKKRADLIPQLVNVLIGVRNYEKSIMGAITELRAKGAEGDATRTLIALQESYPDIKSNENFVLFQRQLAKVEEQIAATRSFALDSITLYNTRISVLPYSLVAMWAKWKPIPLERATAD